MAGARNGVRWRAVRARVGGSYADRWPATRVRRTHGVALPRGLTLSILLYRLSPMKSTRAKLFRNGGSQAVRLPKECRFRGDQHEVLVHREGRRVVLEPVDEWPDAFRACLGAWRDEIPRPESEPISELANPLA